MLAAPNEEPTPDQAIAAAFLRAATALNEAVEGLRKVEHAVGRIVAYAPSLPGRLVADIQGLDRAIQEVANIALFVEALSDKIPADMTADLAQANAAVTLEELALALGGGELGFHPGAAGEFEAF